MIKWIKNKLPPLKFKVRIKFEFQSEHTGLSWYKIQYSYTRFFTHFKDILIFFEHKSSYTITTYSFSSVEMARKRALKFKTIEDVYTFMENEEIKYNDYLEKERIKAEKNKPTKKIINIL